MSKYINKNELIKRLYTIKHPTMPIINGFQFISIDDAIKIVLERPDADVVERKKGRWIDSEILGEFKCSCCGNYWQDAEENEYEDWVNMAKYCPMCGAEMESEK